MKDLKKEQFRYLPSPDRKKWLKIAEYKINNLSAPPNVWDVEKYAEHLFNESKEEENNE